MRASHNFGPSSQRAYTSQPVSPTYEILNSWQGSPATSASMMEPYGEPSWPRSWSVSWDSTAGAPGPQSPSVVSCFVMFVNVTEPSVGMWRRVQNSSRPPSNTPVTMRTRSSPRRIIVRSEWKPPSGVSQGV